MQRRHLGDAMAVVFVRRAQRHIAAGNVGDGNVPRRGGSGHRENLKAVAQQQHRVGAVGGKIGVKYLDGACNGAPHRLGFLLRKNRQTGRDGHTVLLNFLHSLPQTGAQMRARHQQAQHTRVMQTADNRQ